MEWLSSSNLIELKAEQLLKHWQNAKREGFFEVHGSLQAKFSNGGTALLTSNPQGSASYIYEITNNQCTCWVNEENGMAVCSDGEKINGRLPYQSEMTAVLIENIIKSGFCGLPSLSQSLSNHRVFLQAMLQHWRSTVDSQAFLVPIT